MARGNVLSTPAFLQQHQRWGDKRGKPISQGPALRIARGTLLGQHCRGVGWTPPGHAFMVSSGVSAGKDEPGNSVQPWAVLPISSVNTRASLLRLPFFWV